MTVSTFDAPLKALSTTAWDKVTVVADESAYVVDISRLLRLVVPLIRDKIIEPALFRNVCLQVRSGACAPKCLTRRLRISGLQFVLLKMQRALPKALIFLTFPSFTFPPSPSHLQFVNAFIERYTAAFFKCPRIGEIGAQQLALDLTALLKVLRTAPAVRVSVVSERASGDEDAYGDEAAAASAAAAELPPLAVPPMYTTTINKEFPKVEMFIKIIGATKDSLGVMINSLWPERTEADVRNIANLRGFSPKEVAELLATVGLAAASRPNAAAALVEGTGSTMKAALGAFGSVRQVFGFGGGGAKK